MANTPVTTLRLPDPVRERVDAACVKAAEALGRPVSRSQWITEAIIAALEREDAPHVPARVRSALPRVTGGRIEMPRGIQFRNLP